MVVAKTAPRKWRAALQNKTFKKGYVYFLGSLIGLYCLSQGYNLAVGPADATAVSLANRQLLSSGGEIIPGFNGNCQDMASWEKDSFGVIHVIGVTYLFLGIAIICDEQFTSSLESICNPRTGLGLSPDVAGENHRIPHGEHTATRPGDRPGAWSTLEPGKEAPCLLLR